MANPNGTNQFDRFAKSPKYGDGEKLARAQKSAPLSGAPVSALNAPRRAKRHATGQDKPRQPGGGGGGGSAQEQLQQLQPGPIPERTADDEYQQLLVSSWEAVAAHPGASKLVKEYAEQVLSSLG